MSEIDRVMGHLNSSFPTSWTWSDDQIHEQMKSTFCFYDHNSRNDNQLLWTPFIHGILFMSIFMFSKRNQQLRSSNCLFQFVPLVRVNISPIYFLWNDVFFPWSEPHFFLIRKHLIPWSRTRVRMDAQITAQTYTYIHAWHFKNSLVLTILVQETRIFPRF